MGNIHEIAQKHLGTLWSQKKYGSEIEFISPLGIVQSGILCGIVYTQSEPNRDGFNIVRDNPRVDIRISDLDTVPAPGEKWIVRIPASKLDSTLVSYTIEGRPIRNETHGIISLKLKKVGQQ